MNRLGSITACIKGKGYLLATESRQQQWWCDGFTSLSVSFIAQRRLECSWQSRGRWKTRSWPVRWLFWQEYGVFSRVRSARYDDRVAEMIRDRHLEEWLLFKDAEQRICARSSSSPQRAFNSPRRCFLFFFLSSFFPLFFLSFFFFAASARSLIQNLLCRYAVFLDPRSEFDDSSTIRLEKESRNLIFDVVRTVYERFLYVLGGERSKKRKLWREKIRTNRV